MQTHEDAGTLQSARPHHMQIPVALMWKRRWTRMLAIACAVSFASSLMELARNATDDETPLFAALYKGDPRRAASPCDSSVWVFLIFASERRRCWGDTQDAACTLDSKVAHDRCLYINETGSNAVILFDTMPSGSRVKVRKFKNEWETQMLFDAQRPTKKLPESRRQKASKQHIMSISANLDKLVTAKPMVSRTNKGDTLFDS